MTKDSRLNTEAEANAEGVAGDVNARVAVAAHIAEAAGVAGLKQKQGKNPRLQGRLIEKECP